LFFSQIQINKNISAFENEANGLMQRGKDGEG